MNGVTMNEALIQDDNIHPDYAIQLIFLDTVWLIIQCIFEQINTIE